MRAHTSETRDIPTPANALKILKEGNDLSVLEIRPQPGFTRKRECEVALPTRHANEKSPRDSVWTIGPGTIGITT